MRFNDLLQTVLAAQERSGTGAITLWRQCVDMLAQYDRAGGASSALNADDREELVARLGQLRPGLTEGQRVATVVELGGRLRSPALAEFFAADRPAVCVAAMVRARLPDAAWLALVPRLSPTARGVLRSRRDMSDAVRRALEHFGKNDFVLSDNVSARDAQVLELAPFAADEAKDAHSPEVNATEGSTERSQIRELVERIEKFTSEGRIKIGTPISAGEKDAISAIAAPRHFPFETDATGCLVWVGEASRSALVGLSIAEPALPGTTGADGNIAGAFGRRSSFQNGRYWISDGPYGGEWRLSAIPFFDQRSGRFQGYRGQARRPHIHEVPYAAREAAAAEQGALQLDSIRQLIHELRTPLNAILGFAEIIEQQLFGPAGVHYREMAGSIMADARRLLTAFDDLDLAARSSVETQAGSSRSEAVAVEPLIYSVSHAFESDSDRHAHIRVTAAANLPHVLLDPAQAERMLQHLLRTLVSVAQTDETLHGSAWFQPDGEGGHVVLGFDRPARLRGLAEEQLLDPGYNADGDWPDAPLLGLGFSLRLVRSLANGQGGAMTILDDRILLAFPVAGGAADGETAQS